jgi:hypothetical protein
MPPDPKWLDPKWLEILKPGSDAALTLTIACGLFLLAENWKWFPPPAPLVIELVWFGLFLFGSLTLLGILRLLLVALDTLVCWIRHRK